MLVLYTEGLEMAREFIELIIKAVAVHRF